MKRLFIVMLLSLFTAGFAQQSANRFNEEASQNIDENNKTNQAAEDYTDQPHAGPGNPGPNPVPVDDYLPFLVITAVGLIIYVARNKKELLS